MSSAPKSNNLRSTRSSDLCFRRTKPAWCYAAQAPKCIKRFYATLFAHLTNFFRTSFIRDGLFSSRARELSWRGGVRRLPRKACAFCFMYRNQFASFRSFLHAAVCLGSRLFRTYQRTISLTCFVTVATVIEHGQAWKSPVIHYTVSANRLHCAIGP